MWYIILASLISVSCEGSTGVNFIPQNSFYSTYSMWALTFSIDLNPYFENVHQINETIVNLKHEVSTAIDNRRNSIRDPNDNNPHLLQLTNNTSADSRVNVISKLRELKQNLMQQIQSTESFSHLTISKTLNVLHRIKRMYTLDGSVRNKRSLLPWGGDLLNSLFGTATESDLDGIRNQLTSLSANQNDLVHVVENSLTMVNKTNTVTAQNRQAINTMSQNFADLSTKLSGLRNLMLNQARMYELKTSLTNQVTLVTNLVNNNLQKKSNMVYRLDNELSQALQGNLPTTFIDQTELVSILTEISGAIPDSLSLKNFEDVNILWYYKNLPVTVLPDQNKIHVLTVIPLIPLESLFTLYKIVALPLPVIDTIQSSEISLDGTHFAVSDRGNAYVILDEDEIAKCTKSEMTYCPLHRAAMNLDRAPSCLGSLFLEDETGIQNNCPVKILDDQTFPRFRHLIHGKWMVATREPLVIHPKCNIRGEFVDTATVTPSMEIINLNSGCTGYSEFATLPPYFYRASVEATHSASYGRLNIGSSMAPIYDLNLTRYKFNFQLANTHPVSATILPEVVPEDINVLQERLKNIDRNRIIIKTRSNMTVILSVVLGIVLVIVLVAVGYVIYKLYFAKKPDNINVKYDAKSSEVKIDPGRVSYANQSSEGFNKVETLPNLLGSRGDLARSKFV